VSAKVLNIYSGALSFVAVGIRLPLALRRAIVARSALVSAAAATAAPRLPRAGVLFERGKADRTHNGLGGHWVDLAAQYPQAA